MPCRNARVAPAPPALEPDRGLPHGPVAGPRRGAVRAGVRGPTQRAERADRNAMALGGYGSGRGNHLLRDQREWWRGARVEDRPSAGAADQRYGASGGYGSGRERSRKPSSSGSTRIPSKSWTFAHGTCGSTSAARRVLALWLCARPPRLATSSPRAKRSLVSARHLLACLLLHAFATGRPHDCSRAFSLHQGSHVQHLPTLSSNPLAIEHRLHAGAAPAVDPSPRGTDRPTSDYFADLLHVCSRHGEHPRHSEYSVP